MEIVKLFARILLLIAGVHLLVPGVLASVMAIGVGPITVQMVIGVLCVVMAVYFLIKKVP